MSSLRPEPDRKRLDLKLIRRARNGDSRAFARLVEQYQRPLYACIIRIVRAHDLADDVIQESFIRVFRSLHRFDEKYPFYPWLRRIGINLALNRLRSESARAHVTLTGFDQQAPAEDNPAAGTERADMLRCLNEALQQLPEEQRIIFQLRTVEEMSYQEIAQALDISMGTVMSRLNRARSKLREKVRHYL